MTTKELINKLQEIEKEFGEIDIVIYDIKESETYTPTIFNIDVVNIFEGLNRIEINI